MWIYIINKYNQLLLVAFSALTLLVGQQEGHPACKKMGGWWRWALVSPDGVAPSQMVGVPASVNLPLHHKVQKFSSGTGSPGWSQKKGRKTVVVVVLVALHSANLHKNLSTTFSIILLTTRQKYTIPITMLHEPCPLLAVSEYSWKFGRRYILIQHTTKTDTGSELGVDLDKSRNFSKCQLAPTSSTDIH